MICYAREALKNQLNIELDFTHSIARVLLTFILRTGFRQILLVTPHNTQKRRRRRRRRRRKKNNLVGTDDIRGSLLIQFLTQPDRAFWTKSFVRVIARCVFLVIRWFILTDCDFAIHDAVTSLANKDAKRVKLTKWIRQPCHQEAQWPSG